jgi:hypothetical protein
MLLWYLDCITTMEGSWFRVLGRTLSLLLISSFVAFDVAFDALPRNALHYLMTWDYFWTPPRFHPVMIDQLISIDSHAN